MIKPVKRNKRLKWIDSHYSNFYKRGLFFQRCQMAQILTASIMMTKNIKGAPDVNRIAKALAISTCIIAMNQALAKIPQVKGRVTK